MKTHQRLQRPIAVQRGKIIERTTQFNVQHLDWLSHAQYATSEILAIRTENRAGRPTSLRPVPSFHFTQVPLSTFRKQIPATCMAVSSLLYVGDRYARDGMPPPPGSIGTGQMLAHATQDRSHREPNQVPDLERVQSAMPQEARIQSHGPGKPAQCAPSVSRVIAFSREVFIGVAFRPAVEAFGESWMSATDLGEEQCVCFCHGCNIGRHAAFDLTIANQKFTYDTESVMFGNAQVEIVIFASLGITFDVSTIVATNVIEATTPNQWCTRITDKIAIHKRQERVSLDVCGNVGAGQLTALVDNHRPAIDKTHL